MGRWFRGKTAAAVGSFIGSEPATIKATVGSDGALVVNKSDWEKLAASNLANLQGGKIAILVP